jgi:hypothetical protein
MDAAEFRHSADEFGAVDDRAFCHAPSWSVPFARFRLPHGSWLRQHFCLSLSFHADDRGLP